MRIHTASEGITLAKTLENNSAQFYGTVANRYPEATELFLAFAKENQKNVSYIQRTYYGVITDAIEGSYCFDMDPDRYAFKAHLSATDSYARTVEKAVEIEESIIAFYSEAAEQSRPLMADIPRAFVMIAKKRQKRLAQLQRLVKQQDND